jgi:hypothetical protein
MDNIETKMKTPLSDEQIAQTLGILTSDILKYRQLSNYKNIAELLPNNGDYKIILLEWERNSGHWVVCYKINNKYCYFNSYGNAPDKDLNVLTRCIKRILGQDVAEFDRLLGGKKMEYSTKRYQKGDVDTCGRHVIMRINMLHAQFNQPEYEQYMEEVKEKRYPDLSFDEIVCIYVPI